MKYKVGDTVRIKSKAWMDAQPKDADGHIACLGNREDKLTIAPEMFQYAGQTAIISQTIVDGTRYNIYLDDGMWSWVDEMFEDDTIETLQKRIADLEAEVATLKGEKQKQDDPTVYNADKHYVAIWEEQPFLLKCSTKEEYNLLYTFVGMYRTPHRLSGTFASGQRALDEAQTCMCDSDEQPILYVFDTGKEALEFMLKYL